MPSIAIESYLVDELPTVAPTGFEVLRTTFNEGVPRELSIADGWTVIMYAPTGMARAWLDGDPAEIVSSSAQEWIPHVTSTEELGARAAARLVVRRGGAPIGALPLASGVSRRFYAPGAMLELMPLAWEIRAGAMRGGAPASARLELAWRSRLLEAGVLTGAGTTDDGGESRGGGSDGGDRDGDGDRDGGGAADDGDRGGGSGSGGSGGDSGGGDSGGGGSGGPLRPPAIPPIDRVIVTRDGVSGRDIEDPG